jgi:hypothetical protein
MLINENYQKIHKKFLKTPQFTSRSIPKQHNLVTLQLKARAGAAADILKHLADTELKS